MVQRDELYDDIGLLGSRVKSAMDKKDKAILKALQEDATMTVSDLAETIGLSKSACWRRQAGPSRWKPA